jgi:transcriptional regulator with XRE-family HTH domain
MSEKTPRRPAKGFDRLRRDIDADPARRARVEEHKAAMLSDLRREFDLTQAAVAERLEVTQANVSQIERGETDVRLSTLCRYVGALGGRLEVRATFPERTVELDLGPHGEICSRGREKVS